MERNTKPLSVEPQAPLWNRVLSSLGVYVVVAALCLCGALYSPEKFLTASNALNILEAVTLLGIVAIGVSFITYGGHYVDLSIPRLMAVAGFVAVSGAERYGIVGGVACGLAAGALIGLVNGVVVGYLRLNPIIWTLAMSFILEGCLRGLYQGEQVYPDPNSTTGGQFLLLSRAEFLHVPVVSLFMLALAAGGYWLMKRTRFGVQARLTGSAYEAARLSGVRVRLVVLSTYVLSSLTTALAGILLVSLNRQAAFETGEGYDFNAITAVVLGGVALSGGRGSVFGVLGGVLVIGLLTNIIYLIELPQSMAGSVDYIQWIVRGSVFIAVVGVTSWLDRRRGRDDA